MQFKKLILLLTITFLALSNPAKAYVSLYGEWNIVYGATVIVYTPLVFDDSGVYYEGYGTAMQILATNNTTGQTETLADVSWEDSSQYKSEYTNVQSGWAPYSSGDWTVRCIISIDGSITESTTLLQFLAVEEAPRSVGFFNPTSLRFGQVTTLTNTISSDYFPIYMHSIWWDQGLSKFWTNPFMYWGYQAPNGTGFENIVGHYMATGSASLTTHSLTATFRPPFAGTFYFKIGGSNTAGYETNYVPGVNYGSISVGRADPVGTFAGRTFHPSGSAYTVTSADLNATFANPYSAAVAAPTGAVTYTIVGPGTPVTSSTVLAPGTYTLRAIFSGNANYNTASTNAIWTIISKPPQSAVTITSPGSIDFGQTYTATASGGSGTGPLVWSLVGGTAPGAAIQTSTGVVTASATGTVIFRVMRAGDATYADSAWSPNFTLTLAEPGVIYLYGNLIITDGATVSFNTPLFSDDPDNGGGIFIQGFGTGAFVWAVNATTGQTVQLLSRSWVGAQTYFVMEDWWSWDVPYWAPDTAGNWTIYGRFTNGGSVGATATLLNFRVVDPYPQSTGFFTPTTLRFGQAATATNLMTSGAPIDIHTIWWDQGSGKYWTNPIIFWNYPANSTGFENVVGHYISSGSVTITANTLAATFRPPFVGTFALQIGGTNTFGYWAPNVSGVNSGSITVSKADPVGTFAARMFPNSGSAYMVTSADLNATFANPYSAAVAAPTGEANYKIVGPGTPVISGTTLAQGTYTIRASFPGNANYNAASTDAIWTISKPPQIALTITSPAIINLGQPYMATAAGGNGTGTLVWSLIGGSAPGAAINTSSGVVTSAGAGTVIFNVMRTGDANYADSAASPSFILTLNPAVTFAIAPTSLTYNGAVQGPTITPSNAAAPYAVTGTTTATNAGDYTLTATASGAFTGTSGAVAWTIAKAVQSPLSVSASPSTLAYGGTSTLSAVGGTGSGAITFSAAAGGSISGQTFTATAGNETVIITGTKAGDTNYKIAGDTTTITLAQRPVTIALAGTRPYDGGASFSTPLTATASGLLSGDSLASAATVNASVGTYTSLSGLVIRNSANADVTSFYSISYSGSYSVTPAAQPAVTITSASAGTYGTAYTATASGGLGSGALIWSLGTGSTASGAAIQSGSGAVTSTSLGSVVLKVMRAADINYAASAWSPDFTLTLAARAVTITLAGAKPYEGTTSPTGASASITAGSLAAGDVLGYAYANTFASIPGTYAGLTTATVTNAAAPTTRTSSYAITYAGAYTIGLAPQTISFGPLTGQTYGDAPFTVSATATSGLPVSFSVSSGPATVSGNTVAIMGAGSVTLLASQAGNSNFQSATGVSQSFPVAQTGQSVSISPVTKNILQTQSISFTASSGQNGYVWGGTSGASGSGSTKVVSFPSPGIYTVTAQSTNAGNYLASNTATATITVNAAYTLTLTADNGGNVSGAGLYLAGSPATIGATPTANNVFAGWSGSDTSALADPYANSGIVAMSADRSLIARFVDYTAAPTLATVDFGDASLPSGAGTKQALRDIITANTGNSPVDLQSITIVSGGADFSVTSARGSIAAAANITNAVTFNPQGASIGARTARMVVVTTDFALPVFAYNLTANAVVGALAPSINLSISSLPLIFPNDTISLNVVATANSGSVGYYDWRVLKPSGATSWARVNGASLSVLSGNHAFVPTELGAFAFEVTAVHAAGPSATQTIAFTVVQGQFTRVLTARSEPGPELQIWFTPSVTRSQSIDVMRAR